MDKKLVRSEGSVSVFKSGDVDAFAGPVVHLLFDGGRVCNYEGHLYIGLGAVFVIFFSVFDKRNRGL